MKIFPKISLIFLFIITVSSCSKWMDLVPPQGLIREEFWQTKEDVQAVLMGAYESFAQLDGIMFRYGEIRGDLVKADANLGQDDQKVMESNIYPSNYLCDWSKFYQVIDYCNEVIYFAPGVKKKDKTFSDYQLQGYIAEATYLRALSYFYLVRVFKDVPLVLDPSISDNAALYPAKTDGDEILKIMIADLQEVRNGATVDGYITLEEMKGRATKASIDALMADIYLWQFDYEKCIQSVNNIITSNRFKLLPEGEWFNNFYPGNSIESIFEFQFSDQLNQKNSTFGLTQEYSHNYDPGQKALEIFATEYTNSTKKPELTRGEGGSIAKLREKDYLIWKFVGQRPDGHTTRSAIEQNSCGWIVYRYADILLMKAEALSQLGRFNESLSYLNQVHYRATGQNISVQNTETAFEDQILEERAHELAFEGKRWFDLLRMGRRNNFARKDKLIEIIIKNAPSTQKRVLATKLNNPLGWYMPIFDSELERNKELKQNPYYNF